MKKQIRTAMLAAAAAVLAVGSASAGEILIEGFENSADPGTWRQQSTGTQSQNATNHDTPVTDPTPVFGAGHVTEGVQDGRFQFTWVVPGGTATNSVISGGPTQYWCSRNNISTASGLANSSFPYNDADLVKPVLKVDIFNTSLTDTVQIAFHVLDGAGQLERGPLVSLPPNAATAYQWAIGVDTTSGYLTGNGVLAGPTLTLRGFTVYTDVAPTGDTFLDIDNIRIDTPQADLTPPAIPRMISVAQGTNPGELVVKWNPVADVDTAGYHVYLGGDSNFGSPIINRLSLPTTPFATVNSPSASQAILTGVPTEANVYVKVAAFDTATPSANISGSGVALGARLSAAGTSPINLVVLDWDRYTPAEPAFTTDGYNHGIVYWGRPLGDLGRTYVSCRADAIDAGSVTLPAAGFTYWSTARDGELVADQTLTAASQTAITNFLAANGNLIITGTALGEDLTTNGDVADQAFYANVLKAGPLGSENAAASSIDADFTSFPTLGATATGTNGFDVAAGTNDDNEVLTAAAGGTPALTYTGVTTGNAAILSGNNVVYLGFAYETIRDPDSPSGVAGATAARAERTALLTDALAYLDAAPQLDATNWSLYE